MAALQEMELKVLTPLGSLALPEHLEVAFNEGDLLLLFHSEPETRALATTFWEFNS